MLNLLALAPIVLALVLLAVFKVPAKKTMPLAFLVTALLALVFWDMKPLELLTFSVVGGLRAIDILLIVFGALLLFNVLATSGGLNAISRSFSNISKDRRIQAIIIGFGLVSLLEGLAGFGTPAAIAAPLLVALGFSPVAAVAFSLICNMPSTAFGAVGTPTIAMMSIIGDSADLTDLPGKIALLNGAAAIITPLLAIAVLVLVFGHPRSLRERIRDILAILPFALFAGLSFAIPFVVIAFTLGPEMPSIIAGAIALIATVIAAKTGFLVPKRDWHFRKKEDWPEVWREKEHAIEKEYGARKMSFVRAWLPYIMIALTLVLTRIPLFGLAPYLQNLVFSLKDIFGVAGASYDFHPLWIPGTVFIIVAAITFFMHKMDKKSLKIALSKTAKQTIGAALTICFGLALVQVMMNTHINYSGNPSMIDFIAETFALLPGGLYFVVSPLLGIVGAFVSGSNTVSNILFTKAQFATADLLGLGYMLVLALQCVGGSLGNMICAHNVVAASTAAEARDGAESKIIKLNIPPMLIMTGVILLVALVAFEML